MYKFFVTQNQIKNDSINIIEDDVKHIKNVLRLTTDEEIEICNINTSESYICKILQKNSSMVITKIIKKIEYSNETNIDIHIFQGLPKADKLENIIQKSTEIGVCEITPVHMSRCVMKLDDKSKKNKMQRWNKIAESAAKQSKRDKILIVNEPIDFKNIYEKIINYDIVLVAYEEEQYNSLKRQLQNIDKRNNIKIAIIIGPEGGIDKKEIEELINHNVKPITLGKRILRTETAPIVMASNIMYEFDEMG